MFPHTHIKQSGDARSRTVFARLLSDMEENIKGGLRSAHAPQHVLLLPRAVRQIAFFDSSIQRSQSVALSKNVLNAICEPLCLFGLCVAACMSGTVPL